MFELGVKSLSILKEFYVTQRLCSTRVSIAFKCLCIISYNIYANLI